MSVFNVLKGVRGNVTLKEIKQFLKLSEGTFDKNIQKIKFTEAGDGKCVAELKIEEEHTNPMGGLHGGLSATLVDSVTSFALFTYNKNCKVPSVSVDLHMSYMKGATVGDEIVIDTNTLKAGNTLAYLECEIRNKATGDVLVKGRQTKCFMQPRDKPREV